MKSIARSVAEYGLKMNRQNNMNVSRIYLSNVKSSMYIDLYGLQF